MNSIKTVFLLCSAVALCSCAAMPGPDHTRFRRQAAANPSLGTTLGNDIGQLTATGLSALLGAPGTAIGGVLQQPLSTVLGSLFSSVLGRDTPVVFQDQLGATYVLGRLNDAPRSHPYYYQY